MKTEHLIFGLLRISLGWTFLWAFLDKVVGLGFTTCRDAATGAVEVMCNSAWVVGGSPTAGFLKFGTQGPFAEVFQLLAGNVVVDWLFMVGLLGVGTALVLGILTRLAVVSGVAMLSLMYLAALPPAHNPLVDDHVIYSLVLLSFLFMPADEWLGYGKQWKKIVKKRYWLT